jgi:hypothetical protein
MMKLRYQCNSYNLIHNQTSHKVAIQNKSQGIWWDAPGLALLKSNVSTPRNLVLVDHHTPPKLVPCGLPIPASRNAIYGMSKNEPKFG